MKRIYADYSYSAAPRAGCWWDETIAAPDWPVQSGDLSVDVAIVGGGFTGVSAALHLVEGGASVVVLEAETPGWGASGRNGGFCCLGGAKLSRSAMLGRYGEAATREYEQAEKDAITLVDDLLSRHGIAADTHSKGETILAHSARAMNRLRRSADDAGILHEASDLEALGLGGPFAGGYTTPVGFGLNPRKYLFGLAAAAKSQGANLFQRSGVLKIDRSATGFDVKTPLGCVRAEKVLVCTNGYSSEDTPSWMAARYMPVQSTVLVTRPLTDAELQAQGWTSDQIAYDTRHLLHYFRLLPDRRFLFGMRGGLRSSAAAEKAIQRKIVTDFHRMFPVWAEVDITNMWSGMVCLSRDLVPFAGRVPDNGALYAGFAYHGNGVAMGTYCGRALARMALDQPPNLPEPISQTPGRFPLGRWRRLLLPPAYAAMGFADLW